MRWVCDGEELWRAPFSVLLAIFRPFRTFPNIQLDLKSLVLLHSKTFDPVAYLANVHPHATFSDLSMGRQHLAEALESRAEALKGLVEEEFDRFVAVKAATEGVYEEMKLGPLSDGSDFGVKELKDSLKEASTKADQVFTPMIEAAQKGNRLRSTLTVFERNKFFFNLPGVLNKAIEAGRYDAALSAYKKGQFMLSGKAADLLGLGPNTEPTALQDEQAKRIHDKVWTQVGQIMNDLRSLLNTRLRENTLPIDDVEKTIETLLELDAAQDPAWTYLEAQHQTNTAGIRRTYASAYKRYSEARDLEAKQPSDETSQASNIRACILVIETVQADEVIEKAKGFEVWQANLDLVKACLERTLSLIPPFWKLAKAYMDGKYQKRGQALSGKRQNPAACAAMTDELVSTLMSSLAEFFALSAMAQPQTEEEDALPNFVPQSSNALTSLSYMLKILAELGDFGNELGALQLPTRSNEMLKQVNHDLRARFVQILSASWIRDAKIFYRLESWQIDPIQPSTTIYLRHAAAYHRNVARRAYRIAGGSEDRATQLFSTQPSYGLNRSGANEIIPNEFSARIQSAYLDALYALLDGLVHVAFSAPQSLPENGQLVSIRDKDGKSYSIEDVDTRIMLTVSNLAYLQKSSLSDMVGQFETAFRLSMTSEKATLNDVVVQLDKILFDDFVRRKTEIISAIIRHGVLENGIDWSIAPKPTEVHQYMFEALLQLVLIHAQTTAIARDFVPRTMQALVYEMVLEALASFGQVPRFGMGGMLQATLEIEFLHRTLSQYVTAETDGKLQEVYATISKSYYRQPKGDDGEVAEELRIELAELKKTLVASCRATVLQFLCFRAPKVAKSAHSKHSSDVGLA